MDDKTDKLYKEGYFFKKLDAIFRIKRPKVSDDLNEIKPHGPLYEFLRDERKQLVFHEGYSIVYSGPGETFVDYYGRQINDDWYDRVQDFHNGYAIVKKYGKYNLLKRNGKLVSNVWYDAVGDFYEGFAAVKKNNKWNFINTQGELIGNVWYEEVENFHEGYAVVKISNPKQYGLIDYDGKLMSELYDRVEEYQNGYARVYKINKGWNFIDLEGKLINDDMWYDNVRDFDKLGFALVSSGSTSEYKSSYYGLNKIINDKGEIVCSCDGYIEPVLYEKHGMYRCHFSSGTRYFSAKNNKYYDYDDIYECSNEVKAQYGYAVVKKDGMYNYIDKNGELLLPEFVSIEKLNKVVMLSESFYRIGRKIYSKKIDLQGYNVEKKLFGYHCTSDALDDYVVKYLPIKRYGFRYTLCLNNGTVYLFDRVAVDRKKQYKELGEVQNIEYDDNFIFDKKNKKVYLMYEEQKIDITEYYNKYLRVRGTRINITPGIGRIISQSEYEALNPEEIAKIEKEERDKKKREIEEKENARKKQEEEAKNAQLKSQREILEEQRKNSEEANIKALRQILEGLQVLRNNNGDMGKIIGAFRKENKITNIFVQVGDHKEINPTYFDILLLFDLSGISFTNVKVEDVDFSKTNVTLGKSFLDPQTVYQKSLKGCNFTGIYIDPFANFDLTGVDVRGATFSKDSNEGTLDQTPNFEDAIYDDRTTYNGIPVKKIIEQKKIGDNPSSK